ncbi:MAG TPA: hypothetical protein VII67_00330, partial [Acidimicrobiales bacterium]
NPETRQPIYYLASVRYVPPAIDVIAGEVLQSLRSALDHLAYQLVQVGTGQPGPFSYVYFPIFDSAQEYESGKMRKIKGMRQEAIDAIDAIKPYKGGNDTLWQLDHLNIVDKHRLLVTVGSKLGAVDVGQVLMRGWAPAFPEKSDFSLFLAPADSLFPLKAGDVLFTDLPDAEPNEDQKFSFDIAISEPGIIEGEPLVETLHQMVDLVDHLVPIFRPLL